MRKWALQKTAPILNTRGESVLAIYDTIESGDLAPGEKAYQKYNQRRQQHNVQQTSECLASDQAK